PQSWQRTTPQSRRTRIVSDLLRRSAVPNTRMRSGHITAGALTWWWQSEHGWLWPPPPVHRLLHLVAAPGEQRVRATPVVDLVARRERPRRHPNDPERERRRRRRQREQEAPGKAGRTALRQLQGRVRGTQEFERLHRVV